MHAIPNPCPAHRTQLIDQSLNSKFKQTSSITCAEHKILQNSRITSQIRITVGVPKNFLYTEKIKIEGKLMTQSHQNGEHIPPTEWINTASYLSERSIRLDMCLVWAGSVSLCREKT